MDLLRLCRGADVVREGDVAAGGGREAPLMAAAGVVACLEEPSLQLAGSDLQRFKLAGGLAEDGCSDVSRSFSKL
jgi:hypothetical protein